MKGMAQSWETFNRSSEYQSALHAEVESFFMGPFCLTGVPAISADKRRWLHQSNPQTHSQTMLLGSSKHNESANLTPRTSSVYILRDRLGSRATPWSHMFENLDKLMWHNESEHVKRDECVHGNLAQHVYHSAAFSGPQSKPRLWGRGLSDIRQPVSRPSSDPQTRVPVPDENTMNFHSATRNIRKGI